MTPARNYWKAAALTDAEGWFYETLSYGYAIPQGYVGYLLIAVSGSYDGQDAYQEMRLTYGLDGGDDDGDGVLTIYISPYDRFDFLQGENINYWVEVTYDSQPLTNVNICPVVTDEAGNLLSDDCAYTNASGTASYILTYNNQIPPAISAKSTFGLIFTAMEPTLRAASHSPIFHRMQTNL